MRGPVEYFDVHPGFGLDPPPQRRCFELLDEGTRQVDTVVVRADDFLALKLVRSVVSHEEFQLAALLGLLQ